MPKGAKLLFKLAGIIGLLLIIAMLIVPAPKKSDTERDYRAMSSRALQAYFETAAARAGAGVPNIDESLIHFEKHDMKNGLIVTRNSFVLAGNDKITHNYTMQFRKKTGELTQINIDGKQVFYRPELQTAALEDKK